MLILTETWTLPDEDAPAIPDFACFYPSRKYKHPRAVRGSGGIALCVKSSIAELFELWKVPLPGSILGIKSKQKFLHTTGMHHLFIGLVYNPPIHSTFETQSSSLPTLDLLQQNIAEGGGGVRLLVHYSQPGLLGRKSRRSRVRCAGREPIG